MVFVSFFMKNYSFKKFSLVLFFFPIFCFAKDWNFDVLMDGKLIGEHTFQLKEEEKFNQLTSNANFKVTVFCETKNWEKKQNKTKFFKRVIFHKKTSKHHSKIFLMIESHYFFNCFID